MSSHFIRLFARPGGDDEGEGESRTRERPRPPWLGPPQDELGAVVPLALVVGRSERGVVALRHATVHGEGATFDLVALARGLREAQSNRLIHDQHLFDPEEEPSDGFLRIGLELPDGRRVSNLAYRRGGRGGWASIEQRPSAPVFFDHGGGGGSGGAGRVSLTRSFWLWPLPESGAIQVFCEWPVVGIPLSSVELDVGPLVEARERIVPLWPPG